MKKMIFFSILALSLLFLACNDPVCDPCTKDPGEQLTLAIAYNSEAVKAKNNANEELLKIIQDESKRDSLGKAEKEVEKLIKGDAEASDSIKKQSLEALINKAKDARSAAKADEKDAKKQSDFKTAASIAYNRAEEAKKKAEEYLKAVREADKKYPTKKELSSAKAAVAAAEGAITGTDAKDTTAKAKVTAIKTAVDAAIAKVEAADTVDKLKATAKADAPKGEITTALEGLQEQVKDGKVVENSEVSKITKDEDKAKVVAELAKAETALKAAQKAANDVK